MLVMLPVLVTFTPDQRQSDRAKKSLGFTMFDCAPLNPPRLDRRLAEPLLPTVIQARKFSSLRAGLVRSRLGAAPVAVRGKEVLVGERVVPRAARIRLDRQHEVKIERRRRRLESNGPLPGLADEDAV